MITTLKQYVNSSKEDPSEDVHGALEDDTDEPHPALARMRIGQQPSDVDVVRSWRDDHQSNFIVAITYPDETYVIALRWIDPIVLMDFAKAIHDNVKCIDLANRLLS